MKALVPSLVALLLVASAAWAGRAPRPDVAAPARVAAVTTVPGTDSASARPVPAMSTPRDYLAEARAAFTSENREYQRIRVALNLVSPLVGIAVALLLLFTGLAQRCRDVALARARGRWGRVLMFFTLYSILMFVLLFPLDWYEGYALDHRFGLSAQSLGRWTLDQFKALAFQVVAFGVVPLVALAWRAVESSPRRWWLWLALGTLPVAVAGTLLQPLVFDPLFNRFTPLRDEALRRDILALGARANVPARDVYEVDMSTRTRKINAYVSGFGRSQRIVLWDTALRGLSRDEILFVMGHEMGHYVLRHIWKGLVLVALGAFAAFWLVSLLVRAFLRAYGPGLGIHSVGDLAAMPLLVAMLSLVSWLGAPLTNAFSRAIEHEADVYALELTHANDAGARSFLALARGNRSDPEPAGWVKWMLYTHPPLGERIRFALEYRPWAEGRPGRLYRGR